MDAGGRWVLLVVVMISGLVAPVGYGQQERATGAIKGHVLDAETKLPLIGATVLLDGTPRGTTTDTDGRFAFDGVPVGTYVVRFSFVGFEPHVATDVIVRTERITFLDVELTPAVFEGAEVVVTGGYFDESTDQPVSVTGFDAEEVRRAPGSGGDVSRILFVLPSVAKLDDTRNSLVVRGGSPIENAFYVDNIEIPNVNHFPTQGSSGGPIGLLNVDLIEDVQFYAGGFSAAYGGRLSGVMDVAFREGNREEIDVQLDMNLAGLGFVGEGPLGDGDGSWLVSARRSYLDLLVNTFFDDVPVIPTYSDVQAKVVSTPSPRHRVTALGVLGLDESGFDREGAMEVEENLYGPANYVSGAAGLTWRYLWGTQGFSVTTLSHALTRFRVNAFETRTGNERLDNRSMEQTAMLRTTHVYRLDAVHRFEFGAEAKLLLATYDQVYAASVDPLGQPTPALRVDDRLTAAKLGGFVSYRWRVLPRLTVTPGLRLDHFTYTGHTYASPRLAVAYDLTARTSLNAAGGVYRQPLPLVILAQQAAHRELRDPVAYHVVAGVQHLLAEHTRLTVEAYHKAYDHFPLDPTQPALFIIDQLFYQDGFFTNHERLIDAGRAATSGIEAMVQKKLARKVYGLVSGAYFRSRYRGAGGVWRERVFDNRYLFTIEGGFKPNHRHEVSVRWIYAGGAPYTPFDVEASEALGYGVFDTERINETRLPPYHSLNLRYDRRFYFAHSTLVAYLSVWNAYGRRNIATYDWNELDNAPMPIKQWGLLPVFGLEFEF